MTTIDVDFVNCFGQPISAQSIRMQEEQAEAVAKSRQHKSRLPATYHSGWKVVGVPPQALEQAQQDFEQAQKGKPDSAAKMFDRDSWLNAARGRAISKRPYAVPAAAQECAELARKAGWLRVQVIEVAQQ